MSTTYSALGPSTKLTHYLKANDTLPSLTATLQDSAGTALNLSTVSGITFTMKNLADNTLKINSATASIQSPASKGQVSYTFTSSDTDTAGTYLAEFELTYDNGSIFTVPTQGALSVVILEDYNG